jgi:hypothetical protein
MHALNGTSPLESGKGRALAVHFANPRRTVGSQMSETAIAPRKLFVGQASAEPWRRGLHGSASMRLQPDPLPMPAACHDFVRGSI